MKTSVIIVAGLVWTMLAGIVHAADPIRLHPENPHYFLWRDKPTVLITAGEHYGAVLNLDFDYTRYLDELKKYRFNLTRTFSGTYRELAGSFNITGNTLAPAPGRFVCPWARSSTPGALDGGNKFDLNEYDKAYFKRLKHFVKEAGNRGVVVELVLFCTMYDDSLWQASPMNIRNNVNGVGSVEKHEVYNAKNAELLAAQVAFTVKAVTELNEFDNVYYEVCNEPYERGGLTKEWNDRIVAAIAEAEVSLPWKHMIAQGFPPVSAAIRDLNPRVSVLNFHAARPDSVRLNYHFDRAMAFDETGGSERGNYKYRSEGWAFILAGGGVYDHLDFSFTTGRPDGSAVPLPAGTPGGGGPELRQQLAVLKTFIEGFDFVRMKPADNIIQSNYVAGAAGNYRVTALADVGKAYAIYVAGGTQAVLELKIPAGDYKAEWVNTTKGHVEQTDVFTNAGPTRTITSPRYSQDMALRMMRRKK